MGFFSSLFGATSGAGASSSDNGVHRKAQAIYAEARRVAKKLCSGLGPVSRIPSSCFFLSNRDAELCTLVSLVHAFRGMQCIPRAFEQTGMPHVEHANNVMLEVVRMAYADYDMRSVDNAWNSCALATRDDGERMSTRQMFGDITPDHWTFVHMTYTVNWLFFAINGFANCYLQNEMTEMASTLLAETKLFAASLSQRVSF